MGYSTRVVGEGEIISDIGQIFDAMGEPAVNFLVKTRDRNIIRVHLWDTEIGQVLAKLDTQSVKGCLISFRGRLRGTYDEKPTIVIDLDSIYPPGEDSGRE